MAVVPRARAVTVPATGENGENDGATWLGGAAGVTARTAKPRASRRSPACCGRVRPHTQPRRRGVAARPRAADGRAFGARPTPTTSNWPWPAWCTTSATCSPGGATRHMPRTRPARSDETLGERVAGIVALARGGEAVSRGDRGRIRRRALRRQRGVARPPGRRHDAMEEAAGLHGSWRGLTTPSRCAGPTTAGRSKGWRFGTWPIGCHFCEQASEGQVALRSDAARGPKDDAVSAEGGARGLTGSGQRRSGRPAGEQHRGRPPPRRPPSKRRP